MFVWSKWTILGPKMVHPHNSGSAVRIFLKICTMKRVNSQMKVIIMVFNNGFVQDKLAILGLKMVHPLNSGLALRIFLKFCRMKGANRYMKMLLVVFCEKNFIWGYLIFLAFRPFFTVRLGMVKLSQATVNCETVRT